MNYIRTPHVVYNFGGHLLRQRQRLKPYAELLNKHRTGSTVKIKSSSKMRRW